mmetsp:Transcript_12712/g.18692  ORF Transcript_12712/g.18692 Transcript_12712/m.18692 type:complete len:453 (-) Transcript_12712:54-1412(-)|eukprot:CAMPEP_0194213254 /NCGR_PEP_ID=MMETSP0156-20130528/13664_1 /TAXON_ID=33649 /ORGANISM="Thalassionema nitzschioides, Strain L26-B" /LENGTH=452 /DNA_ID=CAMNT_0038941243 /DNA_START=29 /DNA_END=1387 /DNA_ORIENTATION=-
MTSDPPPDRDAFLRKLEHQQEQVTPVDDETLHFLKESGIAASQVDPCSLRALNELISPSKKNQKQHENLAAPEVFAEASSKGETRITQLKSLPQKKEKVDTESNTTKEVRGFASTVPSFGKRPISNDPESSATQVGNAEELSDSKMILRQLEIQNTMIIDMQRRIDHLTEVVHHMAIKSDEELSRGDRKLPPSLVTPLPPPHSQQQHNFPPNNRIHIEERAQVGANPPPLGFVAVGFKWLSELPSRFRDSRTSKLLSLFWSLHQRYVRLNFGLLMKVFLIVTIFSAKMMTRKKAQEGAFWSPGAKLYLVLSLVVTGFLIQSGYLNFFYRFFVKENYVDRIYRGEDIDANEVNWQDPPRRNNENQDNNIRNLIPRDNLFAGNVPRPNGFNIFTDILVLLGSFLLSLLPMWKPQRPEEQPREMNPVNPPEDIDVHAADEDDDEDNNNNNNGGQI